MERKPIRYTVKKGSYDNGTECVEVTLDERPQSIYTGQTEHEAVEWMLLGVAELAFERNLIPGAPGVQGNPDPIQCAMSLLSTALTHAVGKRDWLVMCAEKEWAEVKAERGQLSELIGNLGTAIAALSRVKHA